MTNRNLLSRHLLTEKLECPHGGRVVLIADNPLDRLVGNPRSAGDVSPATALGREPGSEIVKFFHSASIVDADV